MKGWLCISFFVNAALIAACGIVLHHNRESAAVTETAPVAAIQEPEEAAPLAQESAPEPDGANAAPAFSWERVASEDYSLYIDNLRAIHCPSETIRCIIRGAVTEAYAKKTRSLFEPLQPRFWEAAASENSPVRAEFDRVKDVEAKALREERDELLTNLLAPENKKDGITRYESLLGGFISQDTLGKLHELGAAFDAGIESIDNSKLSAVEKNDKRDALKRQHNKELAAALTPAETAEFKARETKQRCAELYGFDVTQEELRTLAQYEAPASGASATNQTRIAADESIKDYLGESRFAQYQRSKAPDFAYLWRLSVRYDLPLQSANDVFDLQHQVQDQLAQIRSAPGISSENLESSLDELQMQARESINAALGTDAALTYSRAAGQWIDKICDDP
jgi:hypothetical protein